MGRKKIKIQPITDERNRHVLLSDLMIGYLYEEKDWIDEEGI